MIESLDGMASRLNRRKRVSLLPRVVGIIPLVNHKHLGK